MKPHPLDNPVWSSLCSRHADLAQMNGGAGRYPPDVAPFVAIDPTAPIVSDDLAALIAPGESVLFVGPAPRLPPPWQSDAPVLIAQMTCTDPIAAGDGVGPEIVELSAAHVQDMLALTALVYPHYFRPRTIAMGRYIGIYDGDQAIAWAWIAIRKSARSALIRNFSVAVMRSVWWRESITTRLSKVASRFCTSATRTRARRLCMSG